MSKKQTIAKQTTTLGQALSSYLGARKPAELAPAIGRSAGYIADIFKDRPSHCSDELLGLILHALGVKLTQQLATDLKALQDAHNEMVRAWNAAYRAKRAAEAAPARPIARKGGKKDKAAQSA